jgi:cytochrome c oxidase cbb3-type subunit 3
MSPAGFCALVAEEVFVNRAAVLLSFVTTGALCLAAQGPARGRAPVFPDRPPADPAVIAHGQQLFSSNCSFCHGPDALGGEGGPNLLRDEIVMHDRSGELIAPIVKNGIPDKGMPKFDALSDTDVQAIAAFVHSLGLGRGGPPVPVNPVVGDAAAGKEFFNGPGRCNTCHSVTGNLAGVGTKYDPRTLQGRILLPGAAGGPGPAPAAAADVPRTTVTVTLPSGQKVEGRVIKIDEFNLSLITADGTYRSFVRNGDVPKVETHDPLQAHKDALPKYTDAQIHNLTAYLVTLK